jgi:hypothetical protein
MYPTEETCMTTESMPFRTLLYRFIFFDWLFKDVSAARNVFERHAALQHNRHMSRAAGHRGVGLLLHLVLRDGSRHGGDRRRVDLPELRAPELMEI